MPMIAGTTSVVDGTLSGELYAALDGIDADVAADTFRRALCAALGLAIATHANETIVEGSASFIQCYHFAFFNGTANTVFPSWNQTAAQTSADVVSARLPCPYGGRVLAVMLRADTAPTSNIAVRCFRASGTGAAAALSGTETLSGVPVGTMRRVAGNAAWTFSQDDWIAIELNPASITSWGDADGMLVVEYTL